MKFTLSWLKDHLETDASLNEITDKLTALGLELEGVEDPAEKFAPSNTLMPIACAFAKSILARKKYKWFVARPMPRQV